MAKRPKLDKKDVKGPDQFQATSARLWKWAEDNIVMVLGATGGLFAVGLAMVLYGLYQDSQLADMQAKYYELEKPFIDIREDFAQAKAFNDSLKGQSDDDRKKALEDAKKNSVATAMPSGDLTKDYGDSLNGLKSFVDNHAATQSAIFAALNLADIYVEYDKVEEALSWIEKVTSAHNPDTMPGALLWTQKGNLQADLGRCPDAISTWQTVLSGPSQQFTDKDLRLRMAICHRESQPDKAKEMFKALSLDFPDSSAGRLAKKYLRGMSL